MPLFTTEFNAGISGYDGGGGPGPYQGVDFFDDPYSAAYLLQAILAMEPHFDMFCYWVFSGTWKPHDLLLPALRLIGRVGVQTFSKRMGSLGCPSTKRSAGRTPAACSPSTPSQSRSTA